MGIPKGHVYTNIDNITVSASGLEVQGRAAHDDPIIGNPLQLGALFTASPDTTDDGDVTRLRANNRGELHIIITDGALTGRTGRINTSNRLAVSVDNNPSVQYLSPSSSADSLASLNAQANFARGTAFPAGGGMLAAQISGTWTGTITFTQTVDGVNFVSAAGHNGSDLVSTTTANGLFLFHADAETIRLEMTAFSSGQADITALGYAPWTGIFLAKSLPSGSNTIGNVGIVNVSGAIPVTAAGGPLTDVCGVNRTGSALNTFLAGTSAELHVTAGALALPVTAPGGAWPVGIRGDMVFNAQTSNPVKFGKLPQVAGAVCADIVAGVASRKIRVLGAYFNSTGTATAIFMTTGASAALTPKIVIANGFVLPANPLGYFETAAGSALTLQIEGGSVGGVITYQEVF